MADNKKVPAKPETGGGKIITKPLSERFSETFFGGTVKEAKSYALHNYIIPGIKDLVYESITGALDRLIHGDSAGYYGYKSNKAPWNSGVTIYTPGSYTNYGTGGTKASNIMGSESGSSRTPNLIAFDRKADAEECLQRMRDYISQYQSCTVERYYDLANDYVKGAAKLISFTDSYYGWTNLSVARVRPYQGGRHIIQLPPTEVMG